MDCIEKCLCLEIFNGCGWWLDGMVVLSFKFWVELLVFVCEVCVVVGR